MALQPKDRPEFVSVLTRTAAVYRADLSADVLELWWEALADYDMPAIRQALTRHIRNPDTGQFMPKPADVIRYMGGTTQDAALKAWAKVHKAIRMAGGYVDVVFDDPLIHAVVIEMGGWAQLCGHSETEMPFRAKEFENRYRGLARMREIPTIPGVLLGRASTYNMAHGHPSDPPVLIGDEAAAMQVLAIGRATDQVRAPEYLTLKRIK